MQGKAHLQLRAAAHRHLSAIFMACLLAATTGAVATIILAGSAQAQHSGGSGGSGGGDHGGDSSGDESSDDHSHDDSDHGDGDHESGPKGKGGQGGSHSNDGHDDDGHDDDSHGSDGSGGKGKGGNKGNDTSTPSGSQQSDSSGSKPSWAQEGIPEIELGRLNMARSPSRVIDRAYNEALANFTADKVAFYNMSIEEAANVLRANFRSVSMIDSPMQNLALLRDVFENGRSVLNTLEQVQNDNRTLAAIFLGSASDKNIEVRPESAYALGKILGYQLSEAQAAALARQAEIIRLAIADGHG